MKNKLIALSLLSFLATLNPQLSTLHAQGTAFTYTGRLNNNGAPANGAYDLRFTIYDASAGGNVVAGPLTVSPVDVANGLFTVRTDFGAGIFTGPPRWLNIEVQPADGGGFTPLNPRQEVTSSPYAIRAATAGTATDVANGSVVKSLNNLRDDLTFAAGANVTITPNGNTLTLAAAGVGGSGIWSVLNNNAYYNAGSVGMGTTAPTPGIRLEVNGAALLTPGGSGGKIQFGTPNAESGMTIIGTARADLRFDGSTLKLLAGPLGGPPSSLNGIAINTSGNVGIGTTSPGSKLEVAGNTRINGRINVNYHGGGGPVTMNIQAGADDTFPLNVRDNGGDTVFYLRAGSPHELHMLGDAYKTTGGTAWIVGSDRRLKQDVRPYETGLKEVLQLQPVHFRYRDGIKPGLTSTHEEVGFIAQEVREVIPDAVTEGQDGFLLLKADPIHWAAINAIQELNAKLEEQRTENAALKQRLEKLEQRMNQKNGGEK